MVDIEERILRANSVSELDDLDLTNKSFLRQLSTPALEKLSSITREGVRERGDIIRRQEQAQKGIGDRLTGQFTRGFAEASSLLELGERGVRTGLRAVGLDDVVSEETFLPSLQDMENFADLAGISFADDDEDPRNVIERAVRIGGASVATGIMILGGLKAVAARGAATGIGAAAQRVLSFVAANKGRIALTELQSIAGAAGLGQLVNNLTAGNENATLAGEIVGSFTPAGAAALVNKGVRSLGEAANSATGSRILGGAREAFTDARRRLDPAGGEQIASEIIRGRVADPAASAARLQQGNIAESFPAVAATGDPALDRLAQGIARENPEIDQAFRQAADAVNTELTRKLDNLFPVESDGIGSLIVGVRNQADTITKRLDDAVDASRESIASRIAQLEPEQRISQTQVIVREQLETALSKAKETERSLWEAIPKDITVPKAELNNALKQIRSPDGTTRSLLVAEEAAIPSEVRNVLSRIVEQAGDTVPVAEVQALRSSVLDMARAAGNAGKASDKRVLDAVADNLLAVMDKAPNSELLQTARAFTREVRSKFFEGDIGRVLRTTGTGLERIKPEQTLDNLIKMSNPAAGRSFDTLASVTGNPETKNAVRNYIASKFTEKAIDTEKGIVKIKAADKFLRDNADLLDRVPTFRDSILEAVKAQRFADNVLNRRNKFVSALAKKNGGIAARLLNAGEDIELNFLFSTTTQSPRQDAIRILNRAQREGEQTVTALRSTLLNRAVRKAANASDTDEAGNALLSGAALRKELTGDKRNADVYKAILGEENFDHALAIADELARLQDFMKAQPDARGLHSKAGVVLTRAASFLALKVFNKVNDGGPASLQLASQTSGTAARIAGNLNSDKAIAFVHKAMLDRKGLGRLLELKAEEAIEVKVPKSPIKPKVITAGFTSTAIVSTAAAEKEEQILKEWIANMTQEEYEEFFIDE